MLDVGVQLPVLPLQAYVVVVRVPVLVVAQVLDQLQLSLTLGGGQLLGVPAHPPDAVQRSFTVQMQSSATKLVE